MRIVLEKRYAVKSDGGREGQYAGRKEGASLYTSKILFRFADFTTDFEAAITASTCCRVKRRAGK